MTSSELESSARAVDVRITDEQLSVRLTDGREVNVPLEWFPRLANARPSERAEFELLGDGEGIHWPLVDEDLSVEGLLRGTRSLEANPPRLPGEAAARVRARLEQERAFQVKLTTLQHQVQRLVCPIYGVHGDEGKPIGSGFLLQVRDKIILITAAHVLYARHRFTLQIPGQTRLVPFGGPAYSTGPQRPDPNPDFDHDIAFIMLDQSAMLEPPGCPVLTPQDLEVDDLPTTQTAYGFVGLPGSSNQALPGYRFQQSTIFYGGQPAEVNAYQRLKYDPRSHFIMSFERDSMISDSGYVSMVPEPYGMSGGPVFKLGSFAEIEREIARPRVIALTIEWWQNIQVLVGVRIAVVTEAIRQLLPEIASELPLAPYLKGVVSLAPLYTAA